MKNLKKKKTKDEPIRLAIVLQGVVNDSSELPNFPKLGDAYIMRNIEDVMVYTKKGWVLQEGIKEEDLREEEDEELRNKEELERTLGHRDTCFSIMYDLLRNDTIPDDKKLMIIKIVVDEQCGQELNLSQQIIYECYYHRVFV